MKKEHIALLILVVISLLIILFGSSFNFISSGFQSVFAAPKAWLYGQKTKIGRDTPEVAKLKSENLELTRKLVDYQKLKNDNVALRGQFETAQTSIYKLIPAQVVGSNGGFSNPTTLIINIGKRDVKRGMGVIVKNTLVGIVDYAADTYSEISLVTNVQFSVLAKTSENGTLGIIKGQNDFVLLDHVSINDKLTTGETVLTQGQGEPSVGVPPDLIVGRIAAVSRSESQPYQTAKVESPIDLTHLDMVFVVKGF